MKPPMTTGVHVDDKAAFTVIGSGFIVDPSGIVLTNKHVVKGARKMVVQMADGRIFPVKKVNTDSEIDLASLLNRNQGAFAGSCNWEIRTRWKSAIGCLRSGARSTWNRPSVPESLAPRIDPSVRITKQNYCKRMPRSIPAVRAGHWSISMAK